ADDCDGDGVSGRAQRVMDPESGQPRLGRLGWKAEKASVAHQVADALDSDMGVSTPLLPGKNGEIELQARDFDDLVTYSRLLGLPARRDLDDPKVRHGEQLFTQIGCPRCHAPDATTGDTHPFVELRGQQIHPYSDLLVHEMGPELADGSGTEQASEWRTAPLWGLGMVETVSGKTGFLHDGRARTPIEAVLWHGGEAEFAQNAVAELPNEDRDALLAFLLSL
ncbi:MAG TPA: di-heme oxidoredictase family protein, partial [Polyangiales bacterium]|nr:di-heme oxidoredictase family protein [Polyangiales bacterium]